MQSGSSEKRMCLGTQLYKRMKRIWLKLSLNSQNLSFKDFRKVVKAENVFPGQIYFRATDWGSLSRLSWAEGGVTPQDKSQVYRRAKQRVKLVHTQSHVPETQARLQKGRLFILTKQLSFGTHFLCWLRKMLKQPFYLNAIQKPVEDNEALQKKETHRK